MSAPVQLIFEGEVLETQDVAEVQRRLARKLKLNAAQLAHMFSGRRCVLKRGLTGEEATRIQAQLRRLGAHVRIEPQGMRRGVSGAASAPASASASAQAQAHPAPSADTVVQLSAVARPGVMPNLDGDDEDVAITPEPLWLDWRWNGRMNRVRYATGQAALLAVLVAGLGLVWPWSAGVWLRAWWIGAALGFLVSTRWACCGARMPQSADGGCCGAWCQASMPSWSCCSA